MKKLLLTLTILLAISPIQAEAVKGINARWILVFASSEIDIYGGVHSVNKMYYPTAESCNRMAAKMRNTLYAETANYIVTCMPVDRNRMAQNTIDPRPRHKRRKNQGNMDYTVGQACNGICEDNTTTATPYPVIVDGRSKAR